MSEQIITIPLVILVKDESQEDTLVDVLTYINEALCIDVDLEEYGHPLGCELLSISLDTEAAKIVEVKANADTQWYVVRGSGKYGKYDDGYYGWDAGIHDPEQIYKREHLPYRIDECPHLKFIQVGTGEIKPTVEEVQEFLRQRQE